MAIDSIRNYQASPAFRGEEANDQRKERTSGITYPALGLAAGGITGYFLKSPNKDTFEASIKKGEKPQLKEGAEELTTEEQKAINDAIAEAKAAPAETTSTPAPAAPAAPTTPVATDAKPVVPELSHEILLQNEMNGLANEKGKFNAAQALQEQIQAAHDAEKMATRQFAPEVKDDEKASLKQQRSQLQEAIEHDQALVKAEAEKATLLPARLAEVKARLEKNNKALGEVNSKLFTPSEFETEHVKTKYNEYNKSLADATKAQEDAEKAVEKAKGEVTEAQTALDKAIKEKKAESELSTLREKVNEALQKQYKVENELYSAKQKVTFTTKLRDAFAPGKKAEERISALEQLRTDIGKEVTTIGGTDGKGGLIKAAAEKAANLEGTAEEIAKADHHKARVNALITGTQPESHISQVAGGAKSEAVKEGASAAKEGEAAVKEGESLMSKAFEAVKGKLPKEFSWGKFGIAAGVGLVAGLIVKYMVDSSSKSEG